MFLIYPKLNHRWNDEYADEFAALRVMERLNPRAKRFGGGGGTKQAPRWTGGQGELFDELTGYLSGQLGQGVPGYPGQLTPGVSNLQQQGFDAYGQQLGPATDYFSNVLGMTDPAAASRMTGGAETGIGNYMQPYDQASAERMMQPMAKLAGQQFNDYTVPAIMERYAGANAADSGAAMRAIGNAGNDMNLGLSAQMAPYLYQGEQNAINRQGAGAQMLGNLSMIPQRNLNAASGMQNALMGGAMNAGGVQRGIEGEQLAEPYNQWQGEQAYNNPWLQYLPTALNATPFDSFYEQGTDYNAMAMNMGAQLGSAAIIASAVSDRRMKENIETIENALEKVEKLDGKTYRYKFKDTRDAGIIAQDIEAVLPEAVEERAGVKFVKLDAVIGLLVNAVKELAAEVRSER